MRLPSLSLTLVLILVRGGPAEAQTPAIQAKVAEALANVKEKKSTLEDLLAQALRNNPDLRVAESKVREAEAELNRVRLQVTQKVVTNQHDVATAKALLEEANARFLAAEELYKGKSMSREEHRRAEVTLQKCKSDLARVEAELPYLLGTGSARVTADQYLLSIDLLDAIRVPGANPKPAPAASASTPPAKNLDRQIVRLWDSTTGKPWVIAQAMTIPAASADKLRQALDSTIKVNFQQASPKDVLDYLQDQVKGINLVLALPTGSGRPDGPPVTLKLQEPVPVGAIFQFLEDHYGWRSVVREYGIVITERDRVPPGAVDLQNFWRNRVSAAEKK